MSIVQYCMLGTVPALLSPNSPTLSRDRDKIEKAECSLVEPP